MSKKVKVPGEILFVIGRVNFQYNDETYYEAEGGGTTPTTAFRDRQKADDACTEASIKEMAKWDLLTFGYSASEVFNDEDAALALFKKVGYEGDLDDLGGMSEEYVTQMTKAQKKELLGYLNVKFFTVNEVELGD